VKIVEWVADDAVRCELLSPSNSLIIRENTGIFAILNVRETTCNRKSHAFSAVLVRIPYSTEQGNIFQE